MFSKHKNLLFLMLVIMATSAKDHSIIELSSKDIELTCNLPTPRPLYFVWTDMVFNTGQDASLIYNSSDGKLQESYVDKKFAIEGSTLSFSAATTDNNDKSGTYTCQSHLENGTMLEENFHVSIIYDEKCEGSSEVREHEPVELVCSYSGPMESKWVSRLGAVTENIEDEVGHEKVFKGKFNATWEHDDLTFNCMVDDLVICSHHLRVKYSMRDLSLPSGSTNLHPGDDVICAALGNPTPNITLILEGPDYKSKKAGLGNVSIPLEEELVGKTLTATCVAWNMVGKVRVEQKKSMLPITERPIKQSVLSESNGSLLIIIVVVVVLLIILIVVTVIILRRKKGKKEKEKSKAGATLLKAETKKDYNSEMI